MYRCLDCGMEFDIKVAYVSEGKIECPGCGSILVEELPRLESKHVTRTSGATGI